MRTYIRGIWSKNKMLFLYGIALCFLLFVLKWIQLRFLIFQPRQEIYDGLLALIFTVFGVWIAMQFRKPVKEEPDTFARNAEAIEKLGLSERESEVLQLLSRGMSNQEIADHLFVSLSTVKTHVSAILLKMEVKSRAKAMEMAKRLQIVP